MRKKNASYIAIPSLSLLFQTYLYIYLHIPIHTPPHLSFSLKQRGSYLYTPFPFEDRLRDYITTSGSARRVSRSRRRPRRSLSLSSSRFFLSHSPRVCCIRSRALAHHLSSLYICRTDTTIYFRYHIAALNLLLSHTYILLSPPGDSDFFSGYIPTPLPPFHIPHSLGLLSYCVCIVSTPCFGDCVHIYTFGQTVRSACDDGRLIYSLYLLTLIDGILTLMQSPSMLMVNRMRDIY